MGLPFKEDEDFRKHNQKAEEAAAEELRNMVAGIESYEAQIKDIQRDKADVFTMAKSKGYNVKALRKLIAERKQDAKSAAELRDAMEHYKRLLL